MKAGATNYCLLLYNPESLQERLLNEKENEQHDLKIYDIFYFIGLTVLK
jgi:hypothetical protein